jgi:hypothetical protein
MAAASPSPAAGGAGAPARTNVSTIRPPLHVSIGLNKAAPMHAGMLYGTGYDPKSTYDQFMKSIPKQIDSNKEMCVGLTKAFTKRSAENCHLLFAVQGDIYRFATYGFATLFVHKLGADQKKYFEIDSFCTKQSFKGVGKLIMNEIKKIASIERNAILSIVLKSTPGAIPFYQSQGFRVYDTAPNKDGLTRMYLNIDGSESDSWKIIPHFSGDPIVPPPAEAVEEATADAAAAAPAPAPAAAAEATGGAGAAPSAGGGRRRRRTTKRRSKGSRNKKYTRK